MLQFFYGRECSHCHAMTPLVEKLEAELGLKFERIETWHDQTNHAKFEEVSQNRCPGVPFFFDSEKETFLCGEVSYDELRKLALNSKEGTAVRNDHY